MGINPARQIHIGFIDEKIGAQRGQAVCSRQLALQKGLCRLMRYLSSSESKAMWVLLDSWPRWLVTGALSPHNFMIQKQYYGNQGPSGKKWMKNMGKINRSWVTRDRLPTLFFSVILRTQDFGVIWIVILCGLLVIFNVHLTLMVQSFCPWIRK